MRHVFDFGQDVRHVSTLLVALCVSVFFSSTAIYAAQFPPFIIIATAHTFTSLRCDRIFSVNGISDLATNEQKKIIPLSFHSFFFFFFSGPSILLVNQYNTAAVQRDTPVRV